MINMPLGSNAALRVVGFYQKDAGYIDNVPGCRAFLPATNPLSCTPNNGGIGVNNAALVKKDYNTVDTYGGRAALKVDLDDNWTITPTVIYQESRSHGFFGSDPRVGDLKVQHFFNEYRKDRFVQAALTIEGKIGNWDVTYAGAYLDRTTASQADYTDYSEAYDSLYSSVGGLAGYFYYQNASGATIDPRQRVFGSDHFKKMSQELRFASPADAPFRVVAGGFYQHQSNDIHQDYIIDNLSPRLSVNGFPGTLWLTQQHRVDKDYAGFGEASYDIMPNLTITAGGRYYGYDNSLIGFFGFGRDPLGPPYNAAGSSRTGVAGCYTADGATVRDATGAALLPAAVSGSPCTNLATFQNGKLVPKSTKDDGFLYRLNLTWKPAAGIMLYGTWSKGYRPGGINRRGTIAPYQADFLINYELGWKTTLAPGLRFNGAVYQQDWQKFQYSFLGQNSFTEIHNGPNARIRGIEADLYYSKSGFTFTASASYTDAKTSQNLCAADDPTYACTGPGNSVAAPKGTRLPVTPQFKGNVTARYDFPIGGTDVYVQGVAAHQSGASSDVRVLQAAILGRLPAFTTVDLAVGGKLSGFTLEAFIDNLFDERGQISRFQACGNCGQRPYAFYIRPMTLGVRVGTKF